MRPEETLLAQIQNVPVVDGLKVRLQGKRVRALCEAQARAHTLKVEKYCIAGTTLAGLDESLRGQSMDPAGQVETKRAEHQKQAAFWALLAEGVEDGAVYLLSENEVQRLLGLRGY